MGTGREDHHHILYSPPPPRLCCVESCCRLCCGPTTDPNRLTLMTAGPKQSHLLRNQILQIYSRGSSRSRHKRSCLRPVGSGRIDGSTDGSTDLATPDTAFPERPRCWIEEFRYTAGAWPPGLFNCADDAVIYAKRIGSRPNDWTILWHSMCCHHTANHTTSAVSVSAESCLMPCHSREV